MSGQDWTAAKAEAMEGALLRVAAGARSGLPVSTPLEAPSVYLERAASMIQTQRLLLCELLEGYPTEAVNAARMRENAARIGGAAGKALQDAAETALTETTTVAYLLDCIDCLLAARFRDTDDSARNDPNVDRELVRRRVEEVRDS